MRTLLALVLLAAASPSGDPRRDFEQAERLYQEGSYGLAHQAYLRAQGAPGQERWVAFRRADTQWRSQAATETPDSSALEEAEKALQGLAPDSVHPNQRDRVWAETQESLGDFYWARRASQNWYAGWVHYTLALEFWAGSSELELAREKYWAIALRVVDPPQGQPSYRYGNYGRLPLEVVTNLTKLARTPLERADAACLLALTLPGEGSSETASRIPRAFEDALAGGKRSRWYDDTLYQYAQWAENGRLARNAEGSWTSAPDYNLALTLYRRLTAEFRKGETPYYDDAREREKDILSPQVQVTVSSSTLPNLEVEYGLSWRNVGEVKLSLYPVDLPRDLSFKSGKNGSGEWLQALRLPAAPLRAWTHSTHDKGEHRPGQATLRLEPRPAEGAYVLEASAAGKRVRELVLVTDLMVVLKTSGKHAVAYVCGAVDGVPVPGAQVALWRRSYRNDYVWEHRAGETNAEGLVTFPLPQDSSTELVVAAARGPHQGLVVGSAPGAGSDEAPWRLYAFTDRPTYRPEDTVRWKVVARRSTPQGYATPGQQTLTYQVIDPRGAQVIEGKAVLNAFGAAWGELPLNARLPLGSYQIQFSSPEHEIGSAQLFRLEEYKLPEFKVSVRTPTENGQRKRFRLGDRVEAEVQAEYYFGGPVANANVEVLVYQRPSYSTWLPERPYPWLFQDIDSARDPYAGGGPGAVVQRRTVKTDALGVARIQIDTPAQAGSDLEYRIEARVIDSSRREVVGSDSVRVARHAYAVTLNAAHQIYRPGETVALAVRTLDANAQPVEVSGRITVTHDRWVETWRDRSGKRMRVSGGDARPPAGDWQLVGNAYEHEEVLRRTLHTGATGEGELRFPAERDGYYRVAWTSQDGDDDIQGDTTLFVAQRGTEQLGYRSGGVELVLDADSVRVGQRAPVLISTPVSGRHVLFTVEGEDFFDVRVVHVTGTAKLVEVAIEPRHVPNLFLGALTVADGEVLTDRKQVVVPPVDHFLEVKVTPDRPQLRPGEKGSWTVQVRDAQGKPVVAEVALGVVDASVYAIQSDLAGDPRSFFFGQKRQDLIQLYTLSSVKPLLTRAPQALPPQPSEAVGLERDDDGRGSFFKKPAASRAVGGLSKLESELDRSALRERKTSDSPESRPATPAQDEAAAVQVRHDFSTTARWIPDARTDASGQARVEVSYPDSLTTWQATARVASAGSQFGQGQGETRTELPLLVRLEGPRFFVEGDQLVLSAVVNNHTQRALNAEVTLEAKGLEVQEGPRTVRVPAGGDGRADWHVKVKQPGPVEVKVIARSGPLADAMERRFTAFPHGVERFVARSGRVGEGGARVKLELPAARRASSTQVEVQIAPSLASTLLDALPYLVEYPYGCTEQTLSRFLPAVIVAKTLRDQGIRPEQIAGRLFGGIEPESRQRLQDSSHGPHDLKRLDALVQDGLTRLLDFQHGDGGWGWWREGSSDPFMTGYVLWGLSLARDAGVGVSDSALARGADWLERELIQQEKNPDAQAWLLHAIVAIDPARGRHGFGARAFDNLWTRRDGLNAYTRSLLILTAHAIGAQDRARALVRALENGVVRDARPDTSELIGGSRSPDPEVLDTAHWGRDGVFYRWSDGGVEATAFALRALIAVDPKHPLIAPVTTWLVRNRRGAQWTNTRDTAIAVLALSDYLRQSRELSPQLEYTVSVNGHEAGKRRLTAQDALGAPGRFQVDPAWLRDGTNEVEIRRTGAGSLYYALSARFFSLEEPIPAGGNELFLRRRYFHQVGRQTLLQGTVYQWQPLEDGGTVTSGERVEAVITFEAKNELSYLLFEDLKPAGLEAVELKSGEPLDARRLKTSGKGIPPSPEPGREEGRYTGENVPVHQELRDRTAAFFLARLPEGFWEVRYALRAEVPGTFHALPTLGHAMYVPEIRANGEETRLTVQDRPD